MGKQPSRAWRESPEGVRKYRETRARAQALADELGIDHGVEPNDLFQDWRHFMLPSRKYRFGHELSCEVVHPTRLDACQPGHGPCAEPGRSGFDVLLETIGKK